MVRGNAFCFRGLLGLVVCATVGLRSASTAEPPYRWFSLPIEVTGVPAGATFVPVSCHVDFSAMLGELGVAGAVDERSLRLYGIGADGAETEAPVQFLSAPQPRPVQRRFLPGTPNRVSYVAEYAAGDTPQPARVAGRLCWVITAESDGSAGYRLRFGVPRRGSAIQVPFPPQNLRAFDAQGRASPVRWFPGMQIRPQWPLHGLVRITDSARPVATYHTGPTPDRLMQTPRSEVLRPFLYPVYGPDGVPLTEYGKPHDPTGSHAHHYSLWVAHADVGGRDFWSLRGGIIAHRQFSLQEDGPVFCRLVQKASWVFDGTELLDEQRTLTVYRAAEGFRLMDLELAFAPAGSEPVTLGQTSFGFLSVRVAQSMTVFDGGGEIRNSRGQRNERQVHFSHAEWLDQSGPVAPGKWNGIAVLDHPDNPNHPTGWHCRNDGWAGASFCLDRAHTIAADATLRLRYRLCLHRHDAVRGNVAGHYRAYAAKPLITLGRPAAE